MMYGYARVSSREQNLDRQITELIKAGVEERNILKDKQSGKDFNRPSYNLLVGTEQSAPLLREGDVLVIYSIDRLGRNYTEIKEQWKYITHTLKADIKVLDKPLLDTTKNGQSLDNTFVSNLILEILSYVAEKEKENINQRQQQGIALRKEKGLPMGRPKAEYPAEWEKVYKEWKNGTITATQSMKDLGLKRNTFYNLAKRYEKEHK